MISALNHLQRLSGNKLFYLLFLVACTSSKKITSSGTQVVNANKDNAPVVNTGPITKTTGSDTLKVDTVKWKIVDDGIPPITIKQHKSIEFKEAQVFKPEYNVKILIPLDADGYGKPSESRFVHFLLGVLLALDDLDSEGVKLNVEVIDTEEGNTSFSQRIPKILSNDPDLIIGPFERADLKLLSDTCRSLNIPIVSPWQTSSKATIENPYFIQMKPNLREHFVKLVQHTTANFRPGEVAIIGRNNQETQSWIKYFQSAAEQIQQKENFYDTHLIHVDSLKSKATAFGKLFKNNKIKAIIAPQYSFADEDFLYNCLGKILNEKKSSSIIVYGMPLMYDSEKIDFDFYHALNTRIVVSDFVLEDHQKLRSLRNRFLNAYGEIPTSEAIKGYDMMLYLAKNLWQYGKYFQYQLEHDNGVYLLSTYKILRTKAEDSPIANDPNKFDFFENKHLDIIEFKENKWLKMP